MHGAPFEVGPYECTPLAEPAVADAGAAIARDADADLHTGGALIRRRVGNHTLEARVRFDEEGFGQPRDAVAYAAARADYLLRVQPAGLVSF